MHSLFYFPSFASCSCWLTSHPCLATYSWFLRYSQAQSDTSTPSATLRLQAHFCRPADEWRQNCPGLQHWRGFGAALGEWLCTIDVLNVPTSASSCTGKPSNPRQILGWNYFSLVGRLMILAGRRMFEDWNENFALLLWAKETGKKVIMTWAHCLSTGNERMIKHEYLAMESKHLF